MVTLPNGTDGERKFFYRDKTKKNGQCKRDVILFWHLET